MLQGSVKLSGPQIDAALVRISRIFLILEALSNEYRSLGATDLKRMVRSEKPVLADIKGLYERESLSKFGFTVFRL